MWDKDKEVCSNGSWAIKTLASGNAANRDKLRAAGAVEVLQRIINDPNMTNEYAEAALNTLR